MAKTYLPGLYFAMKATQRYATKWQAQLGVNMTPQQAACLADLLAALASCLPLFIPAPPIE
jgi:hypothetical protein